MLKCCVVSKMLLVTGIGWSRQGGQKGGEEYAPAGREQYGAWREGPHEDLVFAVALAC
jgi:hypothetical protein